MELLHCRRRLALLLLLAPAGCTSVTAPPLVVSERPLPRAVPIEEREALPAIAPLRRIAPSTRITPPNAAAPAPSEPADAPPPQPRFRSRRRCS